MAGDFHHFFLMETHIYQTSSPEFLKENISPFKSPHHQSTGNQGFPWISQPVQFLFSFITKKKTAKKSSPNQMLLPDLALKHRQILPLNMVRQVVKGGSMGKGGFYRGFQLGWEEKVDS